MQTILVTGGAGYIGSHTIVCLIENGYNVISIDNFSKSKASVFFGIEKITGINVKNYNINLCNYNETKLVFLENKIDAIIHFAALKSVAESVENPLQYYYNNINSLINILNLSKEFNVKQFVFSSSCSVYGNAKELPVTENTPLMPPESPYANTKVIGEQIINDFSKTSTTQFIKLRYFNPAGAHPSALIGEEITGKPTYLIPIINLVASGELPILNVYGSKLPTKDGTCVRDFIHVCDLADAHIKAIEYLQKNNSVKNDIINIGTGTGTTILESINAFEKATNIKLKYQFVEPRKGDVVAIYSNNSLAKEKLNWQPKYSLNDIMATAWQWQLKLKIQQLV